MTIFIITSCLFSEKPWQHIPFIIHFYIEKKVLEMSFDPEKYLREKMDKLIMKINNHELIESSKSSMFEENLASTDEQRTKCLGSINLTLDDIVNGVRVIYC